MNLSFSKFLATKQSIDIDIGSILVKIDTWVDGFIKLLPNIGIALVVFLLFLMLARIVKGIVMKGAHSRSRENLGEVLGGFFKTATLVFGALIAATIIVPSLKPGDLIAGLGIGSVAIGFAFKDILQNWLAGLLILVRQPFEVGDQIVVKGYEGVVEKIETRATLIKTYDGQRAVIPNSDIYTNPVLVKTAYEQRRNQYDVGIGYGDSIKEAINIMKNVLLKIDGIATAPEPEILVWDLAASWVTLRLRWWTESPRSNVVKIRSEIIYAIKLALDEAKIDMPYDTQVHLFHDQSDEHDGIRKQQREGWPDDKNTEVIARWKKE